MTDTAKPDTARLTTLIEELEGQEQRLQFSRFTNDDAWAIGSRLMAAARDRGLVLTVDIRRHGQQLFRAALPGTSADNDAWIERKVRVVNRFNESSYLIGRRLELSGRALETYGVDPALFAPHGGSFPITIRDVGVVGTITVSGLPQADDHALVVEIVEAFLG